MFSKGEIRQNLLGCLEIALFMRAGIARFTASPDALKKSFFIPAALLPLSIFTVISAHPESGALDLTSIQILSAIYTARLLISLAAFLGVVYLLARKLDKLEDFAKFTIANNWITLPFATIMLGLTFMFTSGAYSFAEVYPLMIFTSLYAYASIAFLSAHMLRIPAELACSLAVAAMAINQTSLEALKTVAAQTLIMIS